ncbi:MAG: hypothetical protein ABSG65_15615 [Bryobacteraceae bacterium]
MPRAIRTSLFLVMAAGAIRSQAQQAPPEVDAALRARVNQFYQLEVQGKFNRALQLVAEDTKDLFIGTSKPTYLSVQTHSIRYSDDFTKAEVIVLVTRLLPIEGFMGRGLPTKIFSRWKLEGGLWCYYVDPKTDLPATPFGPMPPGFARSRAVQPPVSAPPQSTPPVSVPPAVVPPQVSTPPAAATLPPAEATPGAPRPTPPMPVDVGNFRALTWDKPTVKLKSSGPSSVEVAIFNPTPWPATLALSDPKVAGLTVKLDPLVVQQGHKAILSILSNGAVQIPKAAITIIVRNNRTNQIIPIPVSFVN